MGLSLSAGDGSDDDILKKGLVKISYKRRVFMKATILVIVDEAIEVCQNCSVKMMTLPLPMSLSNPTGEKHDFM